MTSTTAVADRIRSALGRELKRDPQTITPDQALREDLGLNSLDAIELMFKVEEEFDLEIPDPDLQKLRTVGDLVSYLETRLGGVPAAGPIAAAQAPAPAVIPAPAPPPAKGKGARRPGTPKPTVKRSRA
jgi:acyl carrier protein